MYLNALYFSIVTSFSVGYGDITVVNYGELVFINIFLIVGLAIYSFCLSNLISLFEIIAKKDNFFLEKENSIKDFCRNHKLPTSLYFEIKNYLIDNESKNNSFYASRNLMSTFNELTYSLPTKLNKEIYLKIVKGNIKVVLDEIFKDKIYCSTLEKYNKDFKFININNSKTLRSNLIKYNTQANIINDKILNNNNTLYDDSFLIIFSALSDFKFYTFNDVVYKPGEYANEIFIVWDGKLDLINSVNIKDYNDYILKKSPCFVINRNALMDSGNINYESIRNKARRLYSEEKKKIITRFCKYDVLGEEDTSKDDGLCRKFTLKAKKTCILICLKKKEIQILTNLNKNFKIKVLS